LFCILFFPILLPSPPEWCQRRQGQRSRFAVIPLWWTGNSSKAHPQKMNRVCKTMALIACDRIFPI
jgi:hypothetical protein